MADRERRPCRFRFQPAQRHAWCECGRWEGFLGTAPERAQHKALWGEHAKEVRAAITKVEGAKS